MKKRRRRRRSPPKVSRYRRVLGRLPHSMVALAVVTVGLTFGLASVGWATNGKALLVGLTNTATQPTVLDKAGAGPALNLKVDSGPALAVNTPALVTNLNADQLDGMGADKFAQAGHKHSGADITSGKVGEPFIDDAITRDSEVPSLVGNSFATQSALNDEEAARKAADAQLQNNIDNETAARQAADTALNNNINQEASTRQNADNALGQGDGAANESSDPVDFTKVKNIPADVINRNADTIDGKDSSELVGTAGQSAQTSYGTGPLDVGGSSFTLIPGLEQTVQVPEGGVLFVSTDGGLQTQSTSTTGFSRVDVALFVDNSLPRDAFFRRIVCANTGGQTQMICNWNFGGTLQLSPGSHTLRVLATSSGGTAATVSGNNSTVLQGQLSIVQLNT